MNVASFIERYPRLFHMAERGSWPSIKKRGLLSTAATLDAFGIRGADREAIERSQRGVNVTISAGAGDEVVLRDQKPMPEKQLRRALPSGLSTADWYELINSKTFLWATEARLMTLLNGRQYREMEHDVLTFDTAKFVRDYEPAISLCHMNSGNVFPYPHARGLDIFQRIADYPARKSGVPVKEVAEVTVPYKIENVDRYVTEVRRMKGGAVISNLKL